LTVAENHEASFADLCSSPVLMAKNRTKMPGFLTGILLEARRQKIQPAKFYDTIADLEFRAQAARNI